MKQHLVHIIIALHFIGRPALALLAPISMEGSFNVRISCQAGDSNYYCSNYERYDIASTPLRMVIFNHSEITTVVIYNDDDKKIHYHFTLVSIEDLGETILAKTSPFRPRTTPELMLQFEPELKKANGHLATGWIRDTYFRKDLRIECNQRTNLQKYTKSKTSPSSRLVLNSLIGDYDGIHEAPGESIEYFMRIRRSGIDRDRLIATAWPKGGSNATSIDFTFSSFDESIGVLKLIGPYDFITRSTNTREEIKYALHASESEDGTVSLTGESVYSNYRGYNRLRFTKRY